MALITGLAIEEAAEMELAEGGRFGDSLFGGQVIEAARELLEQQTNEPADPLPLCEFFEAIRRHGAWASAPDPGWRLRRFHCRYHQ